MSNTAKAFEKGKAFIAFITAGDPDLGATEELICAMAEAGADLIEIGIPFSDPVAEGPVIQRADARALAAGTTADGIFDMVKRVRARCAVPLAFMTYINPVYVYGPERFLSNCHDAGVDALIVPDMPFEEREELLPYCRKHGVDLISLISPTSKERVRGIAAEAEGFVYCVSSLGVTGVRSEIKTDLAEMIGLVKAVKPIPCAVGFGVSTPEQARDVAREADGVIVGSAIVRIVEEHGRDSAPYVRDYVSAMKRAIS